MTERIGCSPAEACQMGGIGLTKLYELLKSNEISHRKVGRRTVVSVRSLRSFIEGSR